MTEFQTKDMTASIFRNEKKEEGDRRPNMTGHGMIEGRKVYISAWTKDGKKGKFQSLAFQWADQVEKGPAPAKSSWDDLNDDIPFG